MRYFNPIGAHPSGLIGEDPKGIPNNLMPYVTQVAIGRLPHLTVFGNKYNTPDGNTFRLLPHHDNIIKWLPFLGSISGTGIRDYIHVMDLARGHVAAFDRIKKEGKVGLEVYNLGTGKGYSVLEIVAAMEEASGRKVLVHYIFITRS